MAYVKKDIIIPLKNSDKPGTIMLSSAHNDGHLEIMGQERVLKGWIQESRRTSGRLKKR